MPTIGKNWKILLHFPTNELSAVNEESLFPCCHPLTVLYKKWEQNWSRGTVNVNRTATAKEYSKDLADQNKTDTGEEYKSRNL